VDPDDTLKPEAPPTIPAPPPNFLSAEPPSDDEILRSSGFAGARDVQTYRPEIETHLIGIRVTEADYRRMCADPETRALLDFDGFASEELDDET
jgi:hypothetical protein